MRQLDQPVGARPVLASTRASSVGLDQDASGGDADLVHHQQPQLTHQQGARLRIGDVVARDVQPEALPLEAATVPERDIEVELDPMLGRLAMKVYSA